MNTIIPILIAAMCVYLMYRSIKATIEQRRSPKKTNSARTTYTSSISSPDSQVTAHVQPSSGPEPVNPISLYNRSLLGSEKLAIAQSYKIALESASIVDKTTKLDIFLDRYNLMLDELSKISVFEPRIHFAGMPVYERIDILRKEKDSLISNFIIRDFNNACAKAAKLKTERGRTNAMNRFFASAQPIAESVPAVNEMIKLLQTHVEQAGLQPYVKDSGHTFSAREICDFAIISYKHGFISDWIPRFPGTSSDEPNRSIFYNAKNILVDGVSTDLSDADSIRQMPIPRFSHQNHDVTIDLSYQLKMIATREKDPKIAGVLIPKTAELMKKSPIGWQDKDYRRLAEQLWAVGKVDEGDAFIRQYKCSFADERKHFEAMYLKSFRETLDFCQDLKTDLVEMSAHGSTCAECAKYEGRVFSISGNDKRFPKLPDAVFKYGGIHKGCRHDFAPYIYGEPLVHSTLSAEEYSNRPFIDERTDEQKAAYQKYLDDKEHQEHIWQLTEEYYHKRYEDPSSVPETVYKYFREQEKVAPAEPTGTDI